MNGQIGPLGQDKGGRCKYASQIDSWNCLLCVRNLRSGGTSGWMFSTSRADMERIEAGAWRMESGIWTKFHKCGGFRLSRLGVAYSSRTVEVFTGQSPKPLNRPSKFLPFLQKKISRPTISRSLIMNVDLKTLFNINVVVNYEFGRLAREPSLYSRYPVATKPK